MLNLRKVTDVKDPGSISNLMRSRRMAMFESFIAPLPKPVRILDVGGTALFWKQRGHLDNADIDVTTVNLAEEPAAASNIRSRRGDATNMPEFSDNSFDVVFSNSVIEHLFTLDAQRRMANEVRRIGVRYWVQTPNFWFPIEPHFHVPGWQWMPVPLRIALIRRFRCGWRGPVSNPVAARAAVEEVRLLTGREMRRLFPDATVWAERVMGLTKSWVAHAGFEEHG